MKRRQDISYFHSPLPLNTMHFVISPSAGCFKAVSWRNRNITAPRSTEISSVSTSSFLSDFQSKCATPLPVLKQVADAMESDLRSGISTVAGASLPMLPSYVDSLPSGNETGIFYALDLGGTNFRVLRVLLRGKEKRVVDTEYDVVTIPQELMLGTTEVYFNQFFLMRYGFDFRYASLFESMCVCFVVL